MLKSIKQLQVIVEVDELPKGLFEKNDVLVQYLRKVSKNHKDIFNLGKGGAGGESKILLGDIPGENVVVKLPLKNERTNQINF